jgi:hypothetical protein
MWRTYSDTNPHGAKKKRKKKKRKEKTKSIIKQKVL